METKVISNIFWFRHFKGALFSNFACKLLPPLKGKNTKIAFSQKALVKRFSFLQFSTPYEVENHLEKVSSLEKIFLTTFT